VNVAGRAEITRGVGAAIAIALAAWLCLALIPVSADAGKGKKVRLMAPLKGKHTIPGPGDPDGSGKLKLTIHQKGKRKGKVCYELNVHGLGGVREAKIRRGDKDETGPSLLRLFNVSEPVTGEGTTTGCVKARPKVRRELKRRTPALYAEVENAGYPQGALRGQLRKLGG
jgi:hypothetical protein